MSRRTLTCGLLAGAVALALAPTAASAVSPPHQASPVPAAALVQAAQTASLDYSPKTFVGGQAMTFSGRLPATGRRAISLQQHMGRPGDSWFAVKNFSGATAADGSFRFQVPAPDMWNIRYRVVAAGAVTPSVLLKSKVQGATVSVAGTPRAGAPFTVSVDTSPDIPGRSYVSGTPVFVGRTLTLQRRASAGRWEDLGTTSVQPGGQGYVGGVTLPAGTHVLRVRQEAVTSGANRVGWSTSHPTYVRVASAGGALEPLDLTAGGSGLTVEPSLAATSPSGSASGGTATANGANGWGAMLFDYAWENGESLSDAPRNATSGGWTEQTTGSGRASKHNGQLTLDSKAAYRAGAGDFGTTVATAVGNARPYGRWQARLRMKSPESSARDYAVRLELVPALAADYACGRRNITLGEVRAHGSTLLFGAKAGTRQWTGARTVPSLVNGAPALAVEVQRDHITWFFAGKPVGTVRDANAVSDVPLTLRLSMVGNGTQEMNHTMVMSDWQRAYAPTTGRQTTNGAALRASTLAGGCS